MLLDTLWAVRRHSEALIAPLEPEDLMLQGMADASPPKWHLGHTTWFFDTFVLQPYAPGHQACDPLWSYQFNSITRPSEPAIPDRSGGCSAARPLARCWPGASGWMPSWKNCCSIRPRT